MDKYNAQATEFSRGNTRCADLTDCYRKQDFYTIKCGGTAAEGRLDCSNLNDPT